MAVASRGRIYARASLGFCTFCFHNLHTKGSFGRIFDEKMRSFAMLYGADISRKKRRVFQNVLKYVRKVRAMNWNRESCKDFCEGCESKNTKIAVMCVCVRAWEHHFKICWFTTLLSCSLGVEDKQRSFVFISSSDSKKTSDVSWKTWEIFPKTLEFFSKTWEVFGANLWQFLLVFPRCGNVCGNVCGSRNGASWLVEGLMKSYEGLAKGYNLRAGGK